MASSRSYGGSSQQTSAPSEPNPRMSLGAQQFDAQSESDSEEDQPGGVPFLPAADLDVMMEEVYAQVDELPYTHSLPGRPGHMASGAQRATAASRSQYGAERQTNFSRLLSALEEDLRRRRNSSPGRTEVRPDHTTDSYAPDGRLAPNSLPDSLLHEAEQEAIRMSRAAGRAMDQPAYFNRATAEAYWLGVIEQMEGQGAFDHIDEDVPAVEDYQRISNVCKFFERWAMRGGDGAGIGSLAPEAMKIGEWTRPSRIKREDLQGDRHDIQGINWARLGTTRERARRARVRYYNKVSIRKEASQSNTRSTESYFRFRSMDTEHRAYLTHFQLRNLLSAPSRNDIYFAERSKVMHTNVSTHATDCVIDLTKPSFDSTHLGGFNITSLAASEDVLIAGGFMGEYAILDLSSDAGTRHTEGFITREHKGISNYAEIFSNRHSGATRAAFASNDKHLRILDCATNQIVQDFGYEHPINCLATSPDGRLRVVVGDFNETLITSAETGEPFERLKSHAEDAFACTWADDGIHVATGAQDSRVFVWDARRWDRPLKVITSEMADPRSLRFSPVGGGRRVLAVAEADDFVNIVDAVTFEAKQALDFYGAVAGIAFTPDGSELFVANADKTFGGLMGYERVGHGEAYGLGCNSDFTRAPNGFDDESWEWADEGEMDWDQRVVGTATCRRRRGLGLDEVFT
ncbi:hypothetical protein B0A49_12458 [Cryomyces minteri]|uniref:Uncharacterized protein n=1 Tax=Cryomyces minteri TaxID=331657 RepID=A0A4U0WB26_9PEZI|nr:hypothetical protein B0A49_12458 [Cryomyces minteri]